VSAALRAIQPERQGSAHGVYYEVHGHGVPLLLGFPLMASHAEIFGANAAAVRDGFLSRLNGRYRVLIADYPSVGRSRTIPPAELTLERACADMLAVADAAGFGRFAWWGATFGAVIGMALAARTDRITALVNAGWPPLGVPYPAMVKAAMAQLRDPPPHARILLRQPGQYAQWGTFYGSILKDWDSSVVARIRCPRTVIYGARAETSVGDLPMPVADWIRSRRGELEAQGWRLAELPGCDSGVVLDPQALVPSGLAFLDEVLSDPKLSQEERK